MTGADTDKKEYAVRPVSSRPKMPLSQRAKQFAPFDALSGLSERLEQAIEEHRTEAEANSVIHVEIPEEDR